MKKLALPIAVALFAALGTLYGIYAIQQKQHAIINHQARFHALHKLSEFSNTLSSVINESIRYSDFLSLIVTLQPDIDGNTLETYATLAMQQSPKIVGVQFAPNGIVEHVFPRDRHQAAIGHNLLADPARTEYVTLAMAHRNAVLQGPIAALQGGDFLFNRKAIFYTQDGQDYFWGFSIVAMDFNRLMTWFEQQLHHENYRFALSVDKNGVVDFLWGDNSILTQEAISKTIDIPHDKWELSILPNEGWHTKSGTELANISLFYWLLVAIVSLLTFLSVLHYRDKLEKSHRDPLTGTLNKESLRSQVQHLIRKRKPCVLLLVDLNDFKQVNDSLGHYVGDCVLIEVAHRIQEVLRQDNDLLSRFGGDEYIAIISRHDKDIQQLCQRIADNVSRPMQLEEHQVSIALSIGHASFPADGDSYDDLYKQADLRMYATKQVYRNQHHVTD